MFVDNQEAIDHFTVACFAAWLLNESEAEVEKATLTTEIEETTIYSYCRQG